MLATQHGMMFWQQVNGEDLPRHATEIKFIAKFQMPEKYGIT